MQYNTGITTKLRTLFLDKLNIEVPSDETDLIEGGVMDSLTLVDLLSHMQCEFRMTIRMEELELDSFRSIETIAQFIRTQTRAAHI